MKLHKPFILILLVVFLSGCGNEPTDPNQLFDLTINNAKKSYKTSDELKVVVKNKKNKEIGKVSYSIENETMATVQGNSESSLSLKGQKLGKRTINAVISVGDDSYTISEDITIKALNPPKAYTYNILERYPHDSQAFTQGLEFDNDTLYESTGQRGSSTLRKTNYKTGEVLESVKLRDQYFGEGLTVLNDQIYMLTWQNNKGFIYDQATLKETGSFVYGQSLEGWGLCNDGKSIFKSDGTEKIWRLDPNTLVEQDYIEIYTNTSKIAKVNELEWVDGKIYANIWEKDAIAIVNPSDGTVEGVIVMKELKNEIKQKAGNDVLNGIAYKGEPNILYVTGKNWDTMFKIEIIEK